MGSVLKCGANHSDCSRWGIHKGIQLVDEKIRVMPQLDSIYYFLRNI